MLPFKIDLSGKTAVVTGGGGVLCSVMAKALAECGARVALIGRGHAAVSAVADEITAAGGVARSYCADVLRREQLEEAAAKIVGDFGPCDILINGAGGNDPRATTDKEYFEAGDLDSDTKSFFDLGAENVETVLSTNFLGAFITSQVFGKTMPSGGVIINISSMNAFTPLTKIPAYSAAKSAVSNFTQWLAVHFSKVGIRCNAIAPGFFVTKQNEQLLFSQDGEPTPRTAKILAATPMGRFGEPAELVGALLFLVSNDASAFVNGVILPVDGGFSAYSGV